jgi:hypothetical protein
MSVTKQQLEEIYAGISDSVLLRRYQSGDLTEVAQSVALAELRQRGIEVPSMDTEKVAEDSQLNSARRADLVHLATLLAATEAHILRGCLESQGISAVVADAHTTQSISLLSFATGGVRILVPEDQLDSAKAVYESFKRGDYELSEDDDVGSPEL